VFGVEQAVPLQFVKSDVDSLFDEKIEDEIYDDRFQLLDKVTQLPLAHVNYRLVYDGKSVEGQTDVKGFTEIIEANYSTEVNIYLLVGKDE